ncbi:serine hydrolase [Actinoplanes sp. NPDC051343]|uniref:serine hydrolase n=1 Tax=Actinoplanes sp. NPDC051343 TaxID=3363906 RepID=UPI0037BAEBD8
MAAVGILGGAGLVGLGMKHDGGSLPLAGFSDSAATSKSSPAPTGPTPEELAAQARAKQVTALNAALKQYAKSVPEFSVAVLDKKTGQKFSYRGTETYDTASVVKVQVLACLLMTAQDKGRDLTSTELSLAKRMIHLSDNDATTSLFNKLGKNPAVQACDKRLGLTQTKVNSAWGLTRTTVDDQVKLLAQLVSTSSPLDADSRKLAFNLMNHVDKSQDWGVPAAARTGEVFTVKNGWDTRTADSGRWVVNTVGRITGPSTDVSVAVLSHGHRSMADGIKVVEKVAKMTRQYLKY